MESNEAVVLDEDPDRRGRVNVPSSIILCLCLRRRYTLIPKFPITPLHARLSEDLMQCLPA